MDFVDMRSSARSPIHSGCEIWGVSGAWRTLAYQIDVAHAEVVQDARPRCGLDERGKILVLWRFVS